MSGSPDSKKAAVSDYFAGSKAAVVDGNSATRGAIARALGQLGVPNADLGRFESFSDAAEFITSQKPRVIFADYKVQNRYGLELAQLQRGLDIPDTEMLFILSASSATESAVAEAAEEDVDAFVLRPFTQESIQKILESAAQQKLNPTPYRKLISAARLKLRAESYAEAQVLLAEALKLHGKPSLALYYLAKLEEAQKRGNQAIAYFKKGLEHTPIHYRCLTGLFDFYEREKMPTEAFQIIQTMLQHFPISPQRLARAVSLAIYSKNVEAIDALYDKFLQLDEKTPELTKTLTSAMILRAKTLMSKDMAAAIETFKKAIVSSARAERVVYAAIEACTQHGRLAEAQQFLKLFNPGDLEGECCQAAQFLVVAKTETNLNALNLGQKFLRDPIANKSVYVQLAELARAADKPDMAEEAELILKKIDA